MLWTAPPRHESAIEVGAVRTSHDSEGPGHAKTATVGLDGSDNVGNWTSFTAAGVRPAWKLSGMSSPRSTMGESNPRPSFPPDGRGRRLRLTLQEVCGPSASRRKLLPLVSTSAFLRGGPGSRDGTTLPPRP